MTTLHSFRKSVWRGARVWGLAAVCFLILLPASSFAQMRPLVREMLDNLRAIERITEGVALEDWDRVEDSARELRARSVSMRLLDLETLRMERNRDAVWDAFLVAQEQEARAISSAVRNGDASGVLQNTRKLMGNACLGCHAVFRDPQRRLRKPVLVMTTFLAFWRDINRGLMVSDFDLVGVRSRELSALTEVVGTTESMEEDFGLGGPRQQREFSGFLGVVRESANTISAAAEKRDLGTVLDSFSTMWAEGCVSCHNKFRR